MPNRYPIDIVLYTLPGADAPDAAAVKTGVEQGLASLWPAFGLPSIPEVSVMSSPDPFHLFEFTLRLGGQWAPVPVVQPGQTGPLVFRILSALFTQRTRLVTDEHLRQLRRDCVDWEKTPSSWSSAPLPVWRALAVALLDNGFGLNRLSACLEHWSPDISPQAGFERLIENLDSLTLTLEVGRDLAEASSGNAPGWREHLPDFYQQLYLDLGILLPQARIETNPDLPADQFRLRLNDLWLPVMPGTPPQQAVYDSPGFVLDWMHYWIHRCAGWYVNTSMLEAQLDSLEATNRSLVVMIREQWPTHRLCGILRTLLAEGVSIRNLPEVLDVLLRIDGPIVVDDSQYLPYFPPAVRAVVVPPGAPPAEFTHEQLAGQVRANLKYPIVFPHLSQGVLPCYMLDPDVLRDFRDGFFQDAWPEPGSAFYHLLENIAEQAQTGPGLVFLTPASNRAAIRGALQPYFPGIAVLGYEEIPPFFFPRVLANLSANPSNP